MANKKPRTAPRAPKKITQNYLENAALYYLQRYATSAANLRTVLMRKVKRSCRHHEMEVSPFEPMVDALIARYAQSGLINDASYAQARATSLRRQGHSRKMIMAKLQEKGLASAEIARALSGVDEDTGSDDPELAAAVAYVRRKRLGNLRRSGVNPQKDMAALARAGFSYDVAKAALSVQ